MLLKSGSLKLESWMMGAFSIADLDSTTERSEEG